MGLEVCDSANRDIILNVFFEGTANPIEGCQTLVGLFADISSLNSIANLQYRKGDIASLNGKGPGQYTLMFDGCGYAYGLRGGIFAHGLKEQCSVVRKYVDAFLAKYPDCTITVNHVGQSRGAIAGVHLARALSGYGIDKVILNLLLFDPVPGNSVFFARYLNLWKSVASSAMDISDCENIGNVLVLYPHIPLPNWAFHAPVLIKFPAYCNLEEDVILGCHQGAIWLDGARRVPSDVKLSYRLIKDFLSLCGAKLSLDTADIMYTTEEMENLKEKKEKKELAEGLTATFVDYIDVSSEQLLEICEGELLERNDVTKRIAHSKPPGAKIIRHGENALYLNNYHKKLHQQIFGEEKVGSDIHNREFLLEIVIGNNS